MPSIPFTGQKIGQAIRQELTQHDPVKRATDRNRRKLNKAKREASRKAKKSSPSGEAEGLDQTDKEALISEVESRSSATENMPFESILRALELQRQTDSDGSSSKPDENEVDPGATEAGQQDSIQASTGTHGEHDRESSSPQEIQSSGDGGEESSNDSTPAEESSASNKLVAGLRKELEMEKAKSSMLVRLLEETLHPQAPLPFLRQQYLALMGTSSTREQLK